MSGNQTYSGRKEAENMAEEAAKVSDGLQYPILDVTSYRDSDFNIDPYRFKVECSGVELADLHNGEWLTEYHKYRVEAIHHENQATGVVVRIKKETE